MLAFQCNFLYLWTVGQTVGLCCMTADVLPHLSEILWTTQWIRQQDIFFSVYSFYQVRSQFNRVHNPLSSSLSKLRTTWGSSRRTTVKLSFNEVYYPVDEVYCRQIISNEFKNWVALSGTLSCILLYKLFRLFHLTWHEKHAHAQLWDFLKVLEKSIYIFKTDYCFWILCKSGVIFVLASIIRCIVMH